MNTNMNENISFTKMKYRTVFMLFQKLFQNSAAEIFKIPNVSSEFYWKSEGLVVPIHIIACENISSYPLAL